MIRFHTNAVEIIGLFDRIRLMWVIDNVLSDAIKYSPTASEVQVYLHLTTWTGEPWACIEVRDQGIGIAASDLPHIFERFRRGANVPTIPGSGIGLSAVRDLVEAQPESRLLDQLHAVFSCAVRLVHPCAESRVLESTGHELVLPSVTIAHALAWEHAAC